MCVPAFNWNVSEEFPDFGSLLLLPACSSAELMENPTHGKKNPSKQHNSIFSQESWDPFPLIPFSQLSSLGIEEPTKLKESTLIDIKTNCRREKMTLHQSREAAGLVTG